MITKKKPLLLKDLNVGDVFYAASMVGKPTPYFEVVDKHTGMTGKIRCKNLATNVLLNRMAKLEVIRHMNLS